MKDWNEFDKFEPIIEQYMPPRGEGDTMASQIVTAVNKLVYKWYNDGDVFDNTHGLEGWANDLSSYANWLYKYVPEAQDILEYIFIIGSESEYEDLLYALAERLLDKELLMWKYFVGKMNTIYECTGPFEFKEGEEW